MFKKMRASFFVGAQVKLWVISLYVPELGSEKTHKNLHYIMIATALPTSKTSRTYWR